MPRKPTYEELEQRNKDLEKEAVNCKRTEELLQESEIRFKNVTNSIKEHLVLLDQNFKVQLINTTLAQSYNISLDDYAGKHCYELFCGRNDICEGCPTIKVLNEGKVTRGALRYRPNGRILDRTAYPFTDDNGNITGVIVIGCDITQQKQIEEALRESEEKYRSMMEAMVEPAYICTSDFIVSYMNPAMVKRTGREATGELCHKAINNLDEQCPWCVHDKIQNGENDETIIVSPKDRRLYSISRAPIFH
ncbi:MAG: PAS domain-containing protein, partial [Desulfobacterales bacterium]